MKSDQRNLYSITWTLQNQKTVETTNTQLISVQERKDWGRQFITKEMNPNFSKDPNCTKEST